MILGKSLWLVVGLVGAVGAQYTNETETVVSSTPVESYAPNATPEVAGEGGNQRTPEHGTPPTCGTVTVPARDCIWDNHCEKHCRPSTTVKTEWSTKTETCYVTITPAPHV